MDEAGTRLRRAVRFPTEEDDNPATGLDEQQQEEIISSISQDDAETIAMYRKALMGVVLLGLMFVNMRADYSLHPFYFLACIIALFLSFLIAYDIYLPPIPLPRRTEPGGSGWSDIDIAAIIQRGIDAQGRGVIVLETLRDGMLFARRNAGVANPCMCAGLLWRAVMHQGEYALLLSAAPTFIICILVIVARRELRPLNIAELERLKYNYKGA